MQYKGFTKQARKAMRLAENLAEKEQQTQMGSEYLLAGLLLEGHGVAYEILQQLSVNCEDILSLIHEIALTNLKNKQVMETAKDLNFGSDDMQVVLTALHDVVRRIREVAETHKPLFGGEHFLTGKEVCERLYISPRTLQDYRDRKIIPYTQFAGKMLYKASDLEKLLEEYYKL